jgi:GPH family glycoside/pentoside/hexuronide:cation symporter
MMADVVDESELETGIREEGLFFSTMSFAYKCTVGFGYLFAGILLKWIAFPSQTALADIPKDAIDGLGWIGGFLLLGIYLVSLVFIRNYPIDKARYEEIREQLDRS